MNSSRRVRFGVPAASAALLLTVAAPAAAHVYIPESAVVGGGEGAVIHLRIPHGCEGVATDRLEVQIPEGVIGVTPQAVPGWTVETVSVETEPYELYGSTLTERTSVVRWTGGALEDHQYLDFGISAIFPDEPGEFAFPAVQGCGDQETAWIEIPADGQTEDDMEHPAPTIEVVAAGEDGGLADLVTALQAQVAELRARIDALEAE
jgi:uncharacterized protein YcnI